MQALKFVNVLLASSLFVCFFFGHSLEENEEETDNNGPATTVGVSFYHFFYECFSNVITIVICFHQLIWKIKCKLAIRKSFWAECLWPIIIML